MMTCSTPSLIYNKPQTPKDPQEDPVTTTTRKAAKEAEQRRISQIGDFKARMGGIQELPSGLTVKVRNPGGLQAFMMNGTVPNSLMPLIKEALAKGKGMDVKEAIMPDGEIDPNMFNAMSDMLDSVTMQCVVSPKIHAVPENEEDRSDEELYVDEIPTEDKQFLLQWVTGGTRDLEEFRSRLELGVDDVAASQSAVRAAQSALGADIG